MNRYAALMTLIVLVFGSTAQAGSFTIFDNTFANSDWSLDVIQSVPGTVTAQQVSLGGVHARENDFDSLANGGYLDAINTYTAKSYTPSSQGAILSLSFGESVIGGPYIGPCLLQDGTFYFGPGKLASEFNNSQGSYLDLKQDDFFSLSFAEPNFSATGSTIYFGYYMDLFVAGSAPAYAEDFSIGASAVPEPSSWLTALIGFLAPGGVLFSRRRWAKRTVGQRY